MADRATLLKALRKADAAGDAAAAQRFVAMIKEVDGQPQQSELTGVLDAFTQGATFGFGDELTGLEAGVLGRTPEGGWFDYSQPFEERYKAARDAERAQMQGYGKQSPVLSTGAEIAGAVASPVNKVIAPMMAAPTVAGRIGRGAAVGAGAGAVAGAGGAESISDIPESAAQGAALGGVVGGVAPPAIAALGKTASAIINPFLDRLPFRQRSAAARRIAQAIQDEGLTTEQAIQKVQELGPKGALMDIGENLQGQARAVHAIPGEGRSMIGKFLSARQEGVRPEGSVLPRGGQYERAGNIVDELMPEQYADAKQDVLDARKVLGSEYNTAMDNPLDNLVDIKPMLNDLEQGIQKSKGSIKSGLEKVKSYLLDAKGNPEITIDSLHQAKMAIDDLMTGEARTSMGNVAKSKIRYYQDKLVKAIENSGEAGAAYRAGRMGTAAQWRIDEALDSGLNFMRKTEFRGPEQLKQELSSMLPEEIDAFKTGIAQWMREQMANTNYSANAVKNLIGKPEIEKRLQAVFGDKGLRQFIDAIEREQKMYGTYAMVRGGSPTAKIEAEKQSIMNDPGRLAQGFRGLVSGDLAQMARGAYDVGGSILDRVQLPEGVSREMAEILMGKGTSKALKEQAIKAQMSQLTKDRLSRSAMLSALTGVN